MEKELRDELAEENEYGRTEFKLDGQPKETRKILKDPNLIGLKTWAEQEKERRDAEPKVGRKYFGQGRRSFLSILEEAM